MRATRWLLTGVALLLAAALATAALLPPQLDGTHFQVPLQRIASRALGAAVGIDGPIRLRLLPQPVLIAGRLDVESVGADGGSLTAAGVRLELELGPLLVGRLRARTLVLQRPYLRLPRRFAARDLLAGRPTWLADAAVRIEDGRILAAGMELRAIDARLLADPLTGDVSASGAGTIDDHRWSFAVHLTRPGGDGAAGIDVALTGRDELARTALTLSGQLAADGRLQGRVAAHGPDLSALVPAPKLPFTAEGRISVAAGLAAADDLSATLGGTFVHGAVALRFTPDLRLDLALAANRLDLDPWLPILARRGGTRTMPGGMPLGIDLSAEAGVVAGGVLRGLRLAFDVTPDGTALREFRAVLPGEAALQLVGGTAIAGPARFEGEASLNAPALRRTLAWAAPLLPLLGQLPQRALRATTLSAHVSAGPANIALTDISGTLDGGALAGSIAWHAGGQAARELVSGRLTLQRLQLDPWLARAGAAGPAGPDFDLQFIAQSAQLHEVVLAPLAFHLVRAAGALDLRRLRGEAGPARIEASGHLSAGGRLDRGTLAVDAPHLADLPALSMLAVLPSASPLRQAPLHLRLDASGTRAALAIRLRASLGDLQVEAEPVVDPGDATWNGPLVVRAADARTLLDATRLLPRAGPTGGAAWLGEGSLSLRASGSGGPTGLALDRLELAAGHLRTGGALRLDWAGSPLLSGQIEADTLPLPPLGAALADAMLLDGPPSWRTTLKISAHRVLQDRVVLLAPMTAALSISDRLIRLDNLSAGLGGGSLRGHARLDFAADPRLELRAALQDVAFGSGPSGLAVQLAAGHARAEASVSAAGHSVAAMLATLRGSLNLELGAGSLRGLALAGLPATLPQPAVLAALAGGTTTFDQASFAASLDHGVGRLTLGNVAGPWGRLDVGGSLDLSQDAADLLLGFTPSGAGPNGAPPMIGLRLVGRRGQVQRIPQLAALARWRAAQDEP